jgi:hypothetical protein
MVAFFTFKLANLAARLAKSNQWEWDGPCKADIQGTSLGHLKAELLVQNILPSSRNPVGTF